MAFITDTNAMRRASELYIPQHRLSTTPRDHPQHHRGPLPPPPRNQQVHVPPPPPTRTATSSKSVVKSWWNSPETKRKKRVARYKLYAVEGKVKSSFKKGYRWVKRTCNRLVRGF